MVEELDGRRRHFCSARDSMPTSSGACWRLLLFMGVWHVETVQIRVFIAEVICEQGITRKR